MGLCCNLEVRLILKSVLIGFAITALLAYLSVYASGEMRDFALSFFLPGILLGFTLGSGRVHDLGFWIFVLVCNGVCYALLIYTILWWRQEVKRRKAKAGIPQARCN